MERVHHAVCHRRHFVRLVIATRLPTATHRIHRCYNLILLLPASCCQPMQALIRQRAIIIVAQQIVLRHRFVLWFVNNHSFLFVSVVLFCSAFLVLGSSFWLCSLDSFIIFTASCITSSHFVGFASIYS